MKEKKAAAAHVLAEAQGEVWQEIAVLSDELGAGSPTGALDEILRAKAFDLDAWAKSFPLVDGQVGILAFAVARPLGLDVLAGPNLSTRARTTGSCAATRSTRWAARGWGGGKGKPGAWEAKRFLAVVEDAPRPEAPTVGRGTYRVLGDGVLGGELEDEGRLVHLSAFAA